MPADRREVIAGPEGSAPPGLGESHIRVATKYPATTRRWFEGQGIQAECIKLNGAVELAPALGLCRRIVDLVESAQAKRAPESVRAQIQALPGVAAGDDFRSEFSVRGASFRQMGIVIDGVATPMLVHTVKGRDDTGSVATASAPGGIRAPRPRPRPLFLVATLYAFHTI